MHLLMLGSPGPGGLNDTRLYKLLYSLGVASDGGTGCMTQGNVSGPSAAGPGANAAMLS
jgi:hypothetical protein